MAKKNGTKRNGKRNGRKHPPKGVVPPQLAATMFKPGQVGNPKGINRKPTAFDKLCEMLEGGVEVVELEDGTKLELDAETQGLRKLLNKWKNGPQHATNDPDWRWAGGEILSRRMPVPREPQVVIGNVNVEQTNQAITFVDKIRETTGRTDVTSGDVLEALESETFG